MHNLRSGELLPPARTNEQEMELIGNAERGARSGEQENHEDTKQEIQQGSREGRNLGVSDLRLGISCVRQAGCEQRIVLELPSCCSDLETGLRL